MNEGDQKPVKARKRAGTLASPGTFPFPEALRQLLEFLPSPVLVLVLDREGRIIHVNRPCEELSGYSGDELRGMQPWTLAPTTEREQIEKGFATVLKGGITHREENHWIAKSGQQRLIAWSTAQIREGEQIGYVLQTGIDITEREEALELKRENHALLDLAPEAVIAHNSKGEVVIANTTAEGLFGYTRAEMIGQPLATFVPKRFRARHQAHVAGYLQSPRRRSMGAGLDLFALRKDGSEFPVEVGLSAFETHNGVVAVNVITDITLRKRQEATLLKYQKDLQALTAQLLGLQEAGNKELARELHDNLSQKLAALSMEVATLLQPPFKSPDSVPERVRRLSARINALTEEVHALSRRLHPAVLDELGLEAALREECVAYAAQLKIPVSFLSSNAPVEIPEAVSLCLYRVAQESLRNISKHAVTASVRVTLNGYADHISLRIEDQGRGFEPAEIRGKGGLGLISMEERVRLVNGKLTIKSKPRAGTTVEVTVFLGSK